MKPYTQNQFARLIKQSIIKEHGRLKHLEIDWLWFKRDVTYPTGLKGSTGNLIVKADGFNPRTFLLTASYKSSGMEWTIR